MQKKTRNFEFRVNALQLKVKRCNNSLFQLFTCYSLFAAS